MSVADPRQLSSCAYKSLTEAIGPSAQAASTVHGTTTANGVFVSAGTGDAAVHAGDEKVSAQGDHFAVESLERADPEVALARQLGEGEIALIRPVEQRVERRGLKNRVVVRRRSHRAGTAQTRQMDGVQ